MLCLQGSTAQTPPYIHKELPTEIMPPQPEGSLQPECNAQPPAYGNYAVSGIKWRTLTE